MSQTASADRSARGLAKIVLTPLLISAAFTLACYIAAGPTLGLFLGTLVGVTLLTPPLVLRERTVIARVLAAGAVVDGAAIIWLIPVFWGPIGFGSWMACYLIIACYAVALLGIVVVLQRMMNDFLASAITVIVGSAWLTWPIWLAEALQGKTGERIVGWLVAVHPLFAVNSVLKKLGIWTERPIAYRITNLNQSIPYSLPASIIGCIGLHLLIGILLLAIGSRRPMRLEIHHPD